MKLRIDVAVPTKKEWVETVMEHFDEFLIDHAENERKAQAMALSFIAKYPNRTKIIPDFSPKSQKIAISNLTCFLDIFCIKIGIDGIAISAS